MIIDDKDVTLNVTPDGSIVCNDIVYGGDGLFLGVLASGKALVAYADDGRVRLSAEPMAFKVV